MIEVLTCAHCKAKLPIRAGKNPTFTSIAEPAYDRGWKMARGGWFCGSGCVEMDHLTSSPANAERLKRSMRELDGE